jgi:hypothetical protein
MSPNPKLNVECMDRRCGAPIERILSSSKEAPESSFQMFLHSKNLTLHEGEISLFNGGGVVPCDDH